MPTRTDDWSSYIEGFKRRIDEDERALQAWLVYARTETKRLANVLVNEFGVRRVYLIGSLVDGHVHQTSDIDLAVEGPTPDLYWKASARLERETDIAIDLIDLDDAKATLIERARREGIRLA